MLHPRPCIEDEGCSGQDVHYCGQCGTMCQSLVTFLQHKLCYSTSMLPSICLLCIEITRLITTQDVHDHYSKVHGLKDVFLTSEHIKIVEGQSGTECTSRLGVDNDDDDSERVSTFQGVSSDSIVCDDNVNDSELNVDSKESVITECDDQCCPVVHVIPDTICSTDIPSIHTDDVKLEDTEPSSDEIREISSNFKTVETCSSNTVECLMNDNQVQLIHFESSSHASADTCRCESIYNQGDKFNELNNIPSHILSGNLSSPEDKNVLCLHNRDGSGVSEATKSVVKLESVLNDECCTGKYLCDTCDFRTLNIVDIQNHYIQSHQKKIFVLMPGNSQENLKRNLNSSHCTQDGMYAPFDELTTTVGVSHSKCDRRDNVMNNGAKNKQTISVCKYTIASDGRREYRCLTCGKVFPFARSLRKHEFVHLNEKHFLCDTCGKAFKTTNSLSQHRKSHQKSAYICAECGFSSSISAAIRTHRQLHPDGSSVCEICGTAYKDNSCLRSHMKNVHDPARPYPCQHPGCKWRFKLVGQANAHLLSHTSRGKYNCELCGYSFRYKQHLQRHIVKIHGIHNNKILKTDDNIETALLEPNALDESTYGIIDADQLQIQNAPEFVVCTADTDGLMLNYEVGELSVACETLLEDDDDDERVRDECQTVGFLTSTLCT